MKFLSHIADRLRHRIQRQKWTTERAAGVVGEDLAHRFLRERKFVIVSRNFRPRAGAGEIDIIARDGEKLVFVEVKTRANDNVGFPDRAVGPQKRRTLERAARDYARRTDTDWLDTRFDIVTIVLSTPPVIEHFPAAW